MRPYLASNYFMDSTCPLKKSTDRSGSVERRKVKKRRRALRGAKRTGRPERSEGL